MKYLTLVILMIPLGLIAQNLTQPYGGSNAKWVYNFTGAVEGVTVVEPSRDTLVGNRLLTIFEKATFFIDDYDEMGVWNRAPVYIHSDAGIVEFSTDLIHFDTLYNFQLKIGDSWSIIERELSGQLMRDTIVGTVVDTFSIMRSGSIIFCQEVLWNESPRKDTIFQDFGSRYSYILPFENRKAYGEGNVLLCFANDRLGAIDFETDHLVNCPSCGFTTFEYDCGVISSTTTPVRNTKFSLYPNPAADYLSLQSDSTPIEDVKVYNLEGLLMTEKQLIGQEVELDISNLASGVYILLINDTYYEKIVVQE